MRTENPQADKERLRTAMREFRAGLSTDTHSSLSTSVCLHLRKTEEFESARSIHAFWPMIHRGEVDIRPLLLEALDRGRDVWLPVVKGDRLAHRRLDNVSGLEPGAFGQLEPTIDSGSPFEWPDLILLPGLAADLQGNRLGYGGGFFDRFLSRVRKESTSTALIMVLFEGQIVEKVPVSPLDVPVDALVTEHGIQRCIR